MQTLTLHRDFLKKPSKGIAFLMIVIMLATITILANRKDIVIEISERWSFIYMLRLVLGTILPEVVSLFILTALINVYHQFMGLETIDISPESIARYELKFLPLFLLSFFFFFPITLHLRFALREFPNYSFSSYYDVYLTNGFSANTYLFYLPFVFVLGYSMLNISMFIDFGTKSNRKISVPVPTQNIESKPEVIEQKADVVEKQEKEVAKKTYTTLIEARTNAGTIFLNVKDCYFFMLTADNEYMVEHIEGRFKIVQSISILEAKLDPLLFFRCNRKCIINLDYTGSFVYLDKGKYNLCMKPPITSEFIITKARIEILKEALKANIGSK
jgi:DNA-binding LytR/AlgR family response regulator